MYYYVSCVYVLLLCTSFHTFIISLGLFSFSFITSKLNGGDVILKIPSQRQVCIVSGRAMILSQQFKE